jgi:hypothetical protein
MKKENKNSKETTPSGITRKDAIKKMGKYAALTAVGTFMILNPKEAQAMSAPPDPGWGSGKSSWGRGRGLSKPSMSRPSLSKPSLSKPSISRPSLSKPSLLKSLKK